LTPLTPSQQPRNQTKPNLPPTRTHAQALEISARVVEAASRLGLDEGAARPGPITASFIPEHLDHSLKQPANGGGPAGGAAPQRINRCTHATPSCEFAEEVEVGELRAVAGTP